jgi:hypothetical protein
LAGKGNNEDVCLRNDRGSGSVALNRRFRFEASVANTQGTLGNCIFLRRRGGNDDMSLGYRRREACLSLCLP